MTETQRLPVRVESAASRANFRPTRKRAMHSHTFLRIMEKLSMFDLFFFFTRRGILAHVGANFSPTRIR